MSLVGCAKEEEHRTLDEIFGDISLLESGVSQPLSASQPTAPDHRHQHH